MLWRSSSPVADETELNTKKSKKENVGQIIVMTVYHFLDLAMPEVHPVIHPTRTRLCDKIQSLPSPTLSFLKPDGIQLLSFTSERMLIYSGPKLPHSTEETIPWKDGSNEREHALRALHYFNTCHMCHPV